MSKPSKNPASKCNGSKKSKRSSSVPSSPEPSLSTQNQDRIVKVIGTLDDAKKSGDRGVQRGSSFTAEEDICLVQSFEAVSQDPKHGTDRNFDLIWKQVAALLAERGFDRTAKSCYNRWMSVRPWISKFSGLVPKNNTLA